MIIGIFLYISFYFSFFTKILNELIIPIVSIATFVLIVLHRMEDTKQRKKELALQYRPLLEFQYNSEFKDKNNLMLQSKFNKDLSLELNVPEPSRDDMKIQKEIYLLNNPHPYDIVPLCITNIGTGNAKNIRISISSKILNVDGTNWKLFQKTKVSDVIPVIVQNKHYIIKQKIHTFLNEPDSKPVKKAVENNNFTFTLKIEVQYTDEFNICEYKSIFNEEIKINHPTGNPFQDLEYSIKNISLSSLDVNYI